METNLTDYILNSKSYDKNLRDNKDNYLIKLIENQQGEVVYLLHNQQNNLYKIGYTKDFFARFRQLQNSSGNNLIVVFLATTEPNYSPTNSFIESKLKNYFKNKKIKGEWFNLNGRDLVEIRQYLRIEEFWDFDDYMQFDMNSMKTKYELK